MSLSPIEKHQQTQLAELSQSYDRLTKRIEALDIDIDRTRDSDERLSLKQRQADLVEEREKLVSAMYEVDPPAEIPVAVIAMTREQAEELIKGSLYEAGEISLREHERIQDLCNALQSQQFQDWQHHYGNEPDDWKLHTDPETAIGDVIRRISDHVNHLEPLRQVPLLAECPSVSKAFFDKDDTIRIRIWNRLIKIGGVLIIDAISLFHPTIRENLVQSGVLASPRVAILVLPPVSLNKLEISGIIEQHLQSRLQRFFSRFNEDLDDTCEIANGDKRAVRRWLVQTLPRARSAIQIETVKTNQHLLTERVSVPSQGMENVIFGRGLEQ